MLNEVFTWGLLGMVGVGIMGGLARVLDSVQEIIGAFRCRNELPEFQPGVFYNDQLKLTEIILEDVSTVWCPWGPYEGHAVYCGYDPDGNLVGIKIWDDVRTRKIPNPT